MVYTGVVSQHESTDFVGSLYVGALLAKGYLDRGRTPLDEVG